MTADAPLPDFLTHYYRKVGRPFLTLSVLSEADAVAVVATRQLREPLPLRLRSKHYLPTRRAIERTMYDQFVESGGKPVRPNPHYLVLGKWSHREDDDGFAAVTIPLAAIRSEVVSFTYPDSWVSFHHRTLRGELMPRFPYHGRVYRLEELPALIERYGLPGERWRHENERSFETYIEAQLWDDEPIRQWIVD